jgi:hypothetical protein
MVGGAPPDDISGCANAGWAVDRQDALTRGDMCGATAARCLRMAGLFGRYLDPVVLQSDPTPADDSIHVI